ncbi:MAG: hypothetical protein ACE5JS_11830 [Nitrospinota bacterium]
MKFVRGLKFESKLTGLLAALVATLVLATSTAASAHGIVGPRLFPEPFATEDANPANEFVIAKPSYLPTEEGHEFEYEFLVEKTIFERTSIGFESGYVREKEEEESESGFENLEVFIKQAFFKSPMHEFIFSGILAGEINTGDEDIGAEELPAVEVRFSVGKGLGDIPDNLKYLRPISIQADSGITIPIGSGTEEETADVLSYNFTLVYSMLYLATMVKDLGLPYFFNRLFPVVEFNFQTTLQGPEREGTSGFIRPGFFWVGKFFEAGLAANVPIDNEESDGTGFVGIFTIFLDDVFPALRKPLFKWIR